MEHQPTRTRTPWYRSLFTQLVICVVMGILIGAFAPGFGKQLKPLADGFIRLIKMIIAPLTIWRSARSSWRRASAST